MNALLSGIKGEEVMEIKVSIELGGSELHRVAAGLQTLASTTLTPEQAADARSLVLEEARDAAQRIAQQAFQIGRDYERRNPTGDAPIAR